MGRRKKRKNYIWLGIKGFFKIIWIIIKYIGKGLWWLINGIGWIFHTLGVKIVAWSKRRKEKKALETEAKETKDTSDISEAIESKETKEKSKNIEVTNTPPQYDELIVSHVEHGDLEDFNETLNTRSQIIIIFGKRGSGKSTLGFRLMENVNAKANRPCFVLGVKQSLLPSWITEVKDIEHVANGGIVLVDEGAITFSARESMKKSNVTLGKMLAIARHKDMTLIFITQNTGMIDKNVMNTTDVVIAKEGSLLQKKMERAAVKSFVDKADKEIKKIPKEERVAFTYIFSDDFEGLVKVSLPSFWSQKISKSRA
ncbi:zonular occludens toxin domain-containing protein [Nanoarchaeota archaeon]